MPDNETWRWFAYDYAWRRVAKSDHSRTSPIDPKGVWFDLDLVERAERMYREQFRGRPNVSQDSVREDFERLPARDWTRAELALKMREAKDEADALGIDETQLAIRKIAEAGKKWAMAFRQPRSQQQRTIAPEIPPPPLHPATPARAAELLDKLAQR